MKRIITSFCAVLGMMTSSHTQTALDFDGSDDLIDCGTTLSEDLAGATSLSYEAWVNTSTTSPFGVIIGNYYYPGPSPEMQFLLRRDNDE